jgi:hypothetical protein
MSLKHRIFLCHKCKNIRAKDMTFEIMTFYVSQNTLFNKLANSRTKQGIIHINKRMENKQPKFPFYVGMKEEWFTISPLFVHM